MDEIYHETLDVIKSHDLSIEISTAGIRKPTGKIYPDTNIIQIAKSKGISFTIAADAHTAKDLCHNYDKLENLLRELDINEIAVYEKHTKILVSAFV